MGVKFDTECLMCHFRRSVETAKGLGDDDTAMAFAKGLMQLYLEAPAGVGAPWFNYKLTDLFREYYGLEPDRFREEKEVSNRFVLERLEQIRRKVDAAEDPVYAGLQMAILGNYIDFSALHGQVSFEELDRLLEKAGEMEPDRETFARLCRELEAGRKLLYLTDNAGEIGFDRIFAEELQKRFPHLDITFCVRGGPAMNDATREDAAIMAIPFRVIDSGIALAGTHIEMLGSEAREALEGADVIIAKGQGNIETMLGCGYNVYYTFLVKCARFVNMLGKPKFTPMLLAERE